MIASASAGSRRERSVGGVLPHGPSSAARAATTARSTSASPAIAAFASGSPVAGWISSRSPPPDAPLGSPSMKSPYSSRVATVIGAEHTAFDRYARLGSQTEHFV